MEKKYEGLKKESRERRFSHIKEGKSFRPNLSRNMPQNEIEDHRQDDESFRIIYSNKFYSSERERLVSIQMDAGKRKHTKRGQGGIKDWIS